MFFGAGFFDKTVWAEPVDPFINAQEIHDPIAR